jgi:hypothetical protein
MINVYKDLDRKTDKETPLGRAIRRWKDTIKTDFEEIIWEGLDWVCLTLDTVL